MELGKRKEGVRWRGDGWEVSCFENACAYWEVEKEDERKWGNTSPEYKNEMKYCFIHKKFNAIWVSRIYIYKKNTAVNTRRVDFLKRINDTIYV